MTSRELRTARVEGLGWTQAELAEALGVARETVARWETGRRPIPTMAARLLERIVRERRGR